MPSLSLCATAILLVARAPHGASFSATYAPFVPSHQEESRIASTHLQSPIDGRHFQLEELEGADASSTDVLLHGDLTVSLGETDGPRYTNSRGSWAEAYDQHGQEEGTGECKRLFSMTLTRTFVSGEESESYTDIGQFEYSVERTYVGECFLVGGSVLAMTGEILDIDELFGERKVGYFNMIDTTDERNEVISYLAA